MLPGSGVLGGAWSQVRADLRADPYLRAILVGALVLAAFGVWHGIPNFATWDARDRLFHPLVAYGHVLSDPSFGSLRESLAWSREPFGATFYLYAVALLPVLVVAAITGELDAIAEVPAYPDRFGFFPAWQATPRWIWTWSIVLSRLVNVAFAVGCVYLTYRLGVTLRDRTTGRLAATLLSLTFGFLTLAKEIGEDVPALFFLLLSVYLLLRYVRTGTRRTFYAASAVGGFGMAVKLTVAPVVAVVCAALVVRAWVEGGDDWPTNLPPPRVVAAGAALGAVALLVGFPTLLVGRFDLAAERLFLRPGYTLIVEQGIQAPVWWWFLRGYLQAFGLPLALAAGAGVVASAVHLRDRPENAPGLVLLLVAVVLFVGLFAQWDDFRVHHLLPTVPLALVLLAAALARWRERRPVVATPAIAVLLVLTALYAGVGTAQYASMPQDRAQDWIREHVPENATMETYQRTMDNAAVTHSLDVAYPHGGGEAAACPEYIQLTYRDLAYLREAPPDHRSGHVAANVSERAAHVRALVDGETSYELAAEFGPRPPNFVPRRDTPGSVVDVLDNGIYPHSDQFGDEQDLATDQYTAIFERTGACSEPRSVPW